MPRGAQSRGELARAELVLEGDGVGVPPEIPGVGLGTRGPGGGVRAELPLDHGQGR